MVSRRRFVSDTVLVAILPATIGCSGDDDDGSNPGNCNGVGETSSVDAGHTHTVCVPAGDLMSPPSSGGTYITSTNGGHTHAVGLTAAQLMTLSGGGAVTITSSVVEQHAHTFNLQE
jgi:hypothetical protein